MGGEVFWALSHACGDPVWVGAPVLYGVAVDPSTFLPPPPPSDSLCLHAPWDARLWALEVSFSNDRRLLGRMPEGLDRVLQANSNACSAAGGTPNVVKLKGFCLALEGCVIRYLPGAWDSLLGRIEWESEGLSMTGIPLAPTEKIQRMEQRLYHIRRAPCSLRPSCILVLHMVVAYFLSCANFMFEAVAVAPAWVSRTQRLLKQVAVASLSVLLRVPDAALHGTVAWRCAVSLSFPPRAWAAPCPQQLQRPSP